MQLVSKEFSQVTFLAGISSPRGSLYLPEAVAALKERYGFVKTPETLEDLQTREGVTFSHAKFGDCVIEHLKIYNNGVLAQTKASVEDAEAFLNDLLQLGQEKFDLTISEFQPAQWAYDSHIVVHLEIDVEKHLNFMRGIGRRLGSILNSYGTDTEAYVPTGVTLHADTLEYTGLKPPGFTLERKAGSPFSSNLYFSGAPLRTADHVSLLEEIEELLS